MRIFQSQHQDPIDQEIEDLARILSMIETSEGMGTGLRTKSLDLRMDTENRLAKFLDLPINKDYRWIGLQEDLRLISMTNLQEEKKGLQIAKEDRQ